MLSFCLIMIVIGAVDCDSAKASTDSQYETVMIAKDQLIRGYRDLGQTGIMAFLGIPYALPPTGTRRFEKPLPMSAWKGTRDALALSSICPQNVIAEESEDCLYLNVFTPNVSAHIPVMVYIHEGGFRWGTGMYYDGTHLAGKGVIVVTINYRLSVFGFASTEDDVMPGNYGMLDQILALQWVKKNIHAFGGNASQVTVFGDSAGSTSVSLHLMSPLSVGLFHRGIMESGSFFSLWGVERRKSLLSLKEATNKIGESLGCSAADNSSSLLQCMKKLDSHSIIKKAGELNKKLDTLFIFLPRVETHFNFLPDYPEVLLEAGRFQNIDSMSGFTSGESANVIHRKFPDVKGISRSQFKEGLLEVFTWSSFEGEDSIVERMAEFYLKNVTNPEAILAKLHEAANDLYRIPPLIQLKKILTNQNSQSKHWLYQFDYISSFFKTPKALGLPHGGELGLVFYSAANTTIFPRLPYIGDLSPDDIRMADGVQDMWTNFAKFGNPLGNQDPTDEQKALWPEYTFQNPLMAHIDNITRLARFERPEECQVYWDFIHYISDSDKLNRNFLLIASSLTVIVTLTVLFRHL